MRIVRLYELWTVSVGDIQRQTAECNVGSAVRRTDGGEKYVMKSCEVVIVGIQSKVSEIGEACGMHIEMRGGCVQTF